MSLWLLYTLLTMLLWGGWGVLSKLLSGSLSSWQVQILSTVGLLPVIGLVLCSKNLRSGTRSKSGFWLAFGSGIVGSLGNVAFYETLAAGGKAAAVTPLTALYPIVTIALAVLFLGESLNRVQLGGAIGALTAIYFLNVESDKGLLTPWLALALLPIFLWGVSGLWQKVATTSASNELATAAFLLGQLPLAFVSSLFQPINWKLPAHTWVWLALLGLFFGAGNLTAIFAYGTGGKAAIVTPLASLYSLFTIPLAVFFLNERVGTREALGIGLALVSVVALGWESARPVEQPKGHSSSETLPVP